jgi:hypothetical protein
VEERRMKVGMEMNDAAESEKTKEWPRERSNGWMFRSVDFTF